MEDISWQKKSCESCIFRVDKECRRFPPNRNKSNPFEQNVLSGNPIVHILGITHDRIFNPACAEYVNVIERKR